LDFFESKKLTKVEKFKNELEVLILGKIITNNGEALVYTYECGHFPKNADAVVRKLKREGIIDYAGRTPGVNYDNVFKRRNIIQYKLK
jgi:hypothetical protein